MRFSVSAHARKTVIDGRRARCFARASLRFVVRLTTRFRVIGTISILGRRLYSGSVRAFYCGQGKYGVRRPHDKNENVIFLYEQIVIRCICCMIKILTQYFFSRWKLIRIIYLSYDSVHSYNSNINSSRFKPTIFSTNKKSQRGSFLSDDERVLT